jgi:hypothetical protein
MTLYHITTGAPPFNLDSLEKVMEAHLKKNPVPPDKANPCLSRKFSEMILKMISKDKKDRYKSWDELAEYIMTFVGMKSVTCDKSRDIPKIPGASVTIPDKATGTIAIPPPSFSSKEVNKILTEVSGEQQLQYITRVIRRKPSPKVYITAVSMVISAAILTYLFSWLSPHMDNSLSRFFYKFMSDAGAFNAFVNYILDKAISFINRRVMFNPGFEWNQLAISGYEIVEYTLVVFAVLWSAFWAADTAEIVGKNRLNAFILGLIFPFIYPVILYRRSLDELKKLEETIRGREIENLKTMEKTYPEKDNLYLVSATDVPEAPFIIETTDGARLDVITIFEKKEEYIEVEILTMLNERKRTRIPFRKMKSITK